MLGFALAIVAGLVQGSFTLPMKYTGRWKWEHTWAMWSVWALLILPWVIGLLTVPHLFKVYSTVSPGALALTFAISLGWGIGAITFGMGVAYVGIALGFAIIMGLTTALGSLIPLFRNLDQAASPTGLGIIAGVAVMMLGIAVGAWAGILKEKALTTGSKEPAKEQKPMLKGLIICIIAGVCGSWMNLAFVFGKPIQDRAHELGASETFAPNAVWCISLLGGFIANFGYCCYLMTRDHNWLVFRAERTGVNWFYTAAMGLMWMGSLALYGICTAWMGTLGTAMGFAIFLGMAIITGNLWGLATGEWKGSGSKPLQLMAISVVLLLLGMGVIGWSNTLTTT